MHFRCLSGNHQSFERNNKRATSLLADTASYASRPHLRGAQRGKEQIYNERYDLDHFETADL